METNRLPRALCVVLVPLNTWLRSPFKHRPLLTGVCIPVRCRVKALSLLKTRLALSPVPVKTWRVSLLLLRLSTVTTIRLILRHRRPKWWVILRVLITVL